MIKEPFGDFRDTLRQASDYLRNIQRDGWNVDLFKSVIDLLPNPNKPWEDDPHNPELLDKVRRSLCEQEDGKFYYAFIPIVAGAVATKFADSFQEFRPIAGLHDGGWGGSDIRQDLRYWNHYNPHRSGLKSFNVSLRWLFHTLKKNPDFEGLVKDYRCINQNVIDRSNELKEPEEVDAAEMIEAEKVDAHAFDVVS